MNDQMQRELFKKIFPDKEDQHIVDLLMQHAGEYAKLDNKTPEEIAEMLQNISDYVTLPRAQAKAVSAKIVEKIENAPEYEDIQNEYDMYMTSRFHKPENFTYQNDRYLVDIYKDIYDKLDVLVDSKGCMIKMAEKYINQQLIVELQKSIQEIESIHDITAGKMALSSITALQINASERRIAKAKEHMVQQSIVK